ncbi:MAG: outer membrane lipoprotein carrier protein LolA [Alphaproteobacteria bacterium]|nr:outer membrane lipoprotein carrier protein LolA [Alphaproteobacteria bacterium]
MKFKLGAFIGSLVFLIVTPPSMAAEQAPLAVDRLAEIITGAPDHTAKFHEERRLILLSEPIYLEGTLLFRAPGRYEKHTLSPQREDMVVDGEWVTVTLPDRSTEIRLNMADDSLLHGLLFSLQSLLNGNPEKLSEIFAIEAWGGADGWTLRLEPGPPAMAKRIKAIRVTGEGHWVRTIELWENTGDYLIMTIDSEVAE